MTTRTWIVLPFLLVVAIAVANDNPVAQSAPGAKPTFDLDNSALRKIVREAAAKNAVATPRSDSNTESASAVAAQIGTLPMRKGKTPITVNCDGIAVDCDALDANGNELYRVPRWQVFGVNSGDPSMASPCQSSNNLLSTFERADRCRGVGLLLPTPWDKVNFALPAISQK
jgi:hypothetical protein